MISLFSNAFSRFWSKDGFDGAAILSFTTLFAIVPTLTLMFSIFSLSPLFADFEQNLQQFLFNIILPQKHELFAQYINQFILSAQKLKGLSSVFLLFATALLFFEVDKRIRKMGDLQKSRHFGWGILSYFLVLILTPLLLVASFFISVFISKITFLPSVGLILPFLLSALGLSLLYFFISDSKQKFKNAFKSGVIIAFMLEVLKLLALIYINYFVLYELIYGALSALLLFMLWIYCGWVLVLFGACLNFSFGQED